MRGHRVLALLAVALGAASMCRRAEPPRYAVTVAAPPALAKLLESNLDTVRWSARADVSAEQLRETSCR